MTVTIRALKGSGTSSDIYDLHVSAINVAMAGAQMGDRRKNCEARDLALHTFLDCLYECSPTSVCLSVQAERCSELRANIDK